MQQSTLATIACWLAPMIIAAIGYAAFAGSFTGPMFFDDHPAITRNLHIRSLWPLSEALSAPPQTAVTGRPVVSLSLAINYALGKFDVRGYHVFNLAGHLLAGLALFGVVRQSLVRFCSCRRSPLHATLLAAACAIVWVVHPLTTDTVLYISNRTELLMALFFLLTLYCAIRASDGKLRGMWTMLSIGCCLLGMLSKEAMAAAPLVVLLYDWAFLRESFGSILPRRKWLYAGLFAMWIPLAIVVFSGARSKSVGFDLGVTWWEYLMTQTWALLIYLKLSAWPDPLLVIYDHIPVVKQLSQAIVPGLVIIILLLATAIALWKRFWLGLIGAWFFLILAPSSSVVPLVTELITERRMYLPLAGIVVMVIVLGDRLLMALQSSAGVPAWLGRSVAMLAVVALCIALGFATHQRSNDFKSEIAIWQDTVRNAPDSYTARNSLALALAAQGRFDEAIAHYQHAIKIKPTFAEAHDNLGVAYAITRQYDKALEQLRIAAELAEHPHILNDLAYLLATCPDARIRNGPLAVQLAQRACELGGDEPGLLDTLAAALAEAGRFEEAAQIATRALHTAAVREESQLAADIAQRLTLYQRGQPFHEP